jgi:hypothetical protein
MHWNQNLLFKKCALHVFIVINNFPTVELYRLRDDKESSRLKNTYFTFAHIAESNMTEGGEKNVQNRKLHKRKKLHFAAPFN